MPDIFSPGQVRGSSLPREAIAIDTKKIYDCCRDKECLQDIRVYLTQRSQSVLDNAINVKPSGAELLWAYTDVDPVPFNKGYFTVDVKFFYRITAEAFSGVGRPVEISGLATYDKRTVLFGSEGEVKIFSSQYEGAANSVPTGRSNLPIAVVEAVEPVLLGVNMVSNVQNADVISDIPENICGYFDGDFVLYDAANVLYATLGQFCMIRLERESQLVVPSYGNFIPDKECAGMTDEPCELFRNFCFPVDEFFPPRSRTCPNGNVRRSGR